jgi:hypothetical protein
LRQGGHYFVSWNTGSSIKTVISRHTRYARLQQKQAGCFCELKIFLMKTDWR